MQPDFTRLETVRDQLSVTADTVCEYSIAYSCTTRIMNGETSLSYNTELSGFILNNLVVLDRLPQSSLCHESIQCHCRFVYYSPSLDCI